MKKVDYLIILISFLIANFILLLNIKNIKNNNNLIVIITRYGNIEKVLDLNKDNIIKLNFKNEENILEIKNKKVKMIEANCPDKLCIYQKSIEKQGDMIVCLPHGIIVEIVSKLYKEDGEIDAIAN